MSAKLFIMQILFSEIDMRGTEVIEDESKRGYKLWEKKMHKGEKKNISIQVLLEKCLKVQLHGFVSQLCA